METLEQKVYSGEKAREVLDNEAFQWAVDEIDKELTEAWKFSPARDADGRERIFLMQQMLYKMQQALKTTLETGQLAKEELRYKQSLADRAKESLQRFVPF
jgi:hypothetical protein